MAELTAPLLRWSVSGQSDAERAQTLAVISDQERVRYESLVDPRRERFLRGRLMLRELAAELTGLTPAEVPITNRCPDCGGDHGQPMVEGSAARLGLSYSGQAVVAVAALDGLLGVDVESAALPAARLDAIQALTGHRSVRHWTDVEATLKADGRGLRVDPGAVTVDAGWATIGAEPRRFELTHPQLHPSLVVSVARAG